MGGQSSCLRIRMAFLGMSPYSQWPDGTGNVTSQWSVIKRPPHAEPAIAGAAHCRIPKSATPMRLPPDESVCP